MIRNLRRCLRCASCSLRWGTSSFDFVEFKMLLEQVLGREIDLIDYGGLKSRLDDDIRREAVPL